MDILEALRTAQGTASDESFAARLHVSKSTWVETRTGTVPIRWTIACAILAYVPELTAELLTYMREEARRPRRRQGQRAVA